MEQANEHETIRQMLGHGLLDEDKRYGLQTIKDNVILITPRILDLVVLPNKGKWSGADRERETDVEFIRQRKQHSAVESAINTLDVHGLDCCLDNGLNGFKRFVAWAVVARNLHKLGTILRDQELEKIRKEKQRLER